MLWHPQLYLLSRKSDTHELGASQNGLASYVSYILARSIRESNRNCNSTVQCNWNFLDCKGLGTTAQQPAVQLYFTAKLTAVTCMILSAG
jgi:hypothetical protein